MDIKTPERKPFIYYYVVTMLVVMLLNAFVFPSIMGKTVTDVEYSAFLDMVESGKVDEVAMDERQITFTSKDAAGKETYFRTGIWPDDDLSARLRDNKVSFAAKIPAENSPLANFVTTWLLPILLFVGIGQYLSGRMMKGGMNAMSFGKSNARIYVEAQTGKTFDDVAGQDEAKEALMELVDFLHNPERYTEIGATLPKGALLVGPPGTGKTLLAKAVAGEAKVPFFSISGSEFVEMFVGMGAAKVRDLFKQANEKAPCIVFIDEIDTIGKKRDGSIMGGHDEREQTLNQLLSEMDGFDSRKGVVILAATNRPDSLDKALLRPGRFDRRIPVELPDFAGRVAILKVHAKRFKLADDVDFDKIAHATVGASGAELANMINEAAVRAVRLHKAVIEQIDLEESVETVLAGYQRKNAVISPRERQIVAYHEIGHAIVAACQSESAPVHKITIIPRTSGALGYTMQVAEEETLLMTRDEILNKIATFVAGRAAEELVFGSITNGASNDIEEATRLARTMVTRFGMSETFGMTALETVSNRYLGGDTSLACSDDTAAQIDREVIDIIKTQYEKAKAILKKNAEQLHAIAEVLLEKEVITGDELKEIMKSGNCEAREGKKPLLPSPIKPVERVKEERAKEDESPPSAISAAAGEI
jgi:cell division protease FtsH